VVDAWIPGARCVRAQADGGTLRGGAPRVVWQALGADPRLISAHSAAQRLDQDGRPPHLVWNPLSGDIAQLIPVVRAGCLLGAPESLEYGRSDPGPSLADAANREGRLCVQVGVVAWAQQPFTGGPMYGVERILGWLHSWGVPWRWPAGRPAPFAQTRTIERSRARWALGGPFGARPGRHRHRPAGPGPGHPLPGHLPSAQTQARDGQPQPPGRPGDDAGARDRQGRRPPLTGQRPALRPGHKGLTGKTFDRRGADGAG